MSREAPEIQIPRLARQGRWPFSQGAWRTRGPSEKVDGLQPSTSLLAFGGMEVTVLPSSQEGSRKIPHMHRAHGLPK